MKNRKIVNENCYQLQKLWEVMNMNELLENEAFCVGVAVGLDLYRRKVIAAHETREPLMINGELYYLLDGRERLLQEIINEIFARFCLGK